MVGPSSSSHNTILINNLHAGIPLHIQTNDNSSTTLISFKLQELESTFEKVDGSVIFNLLQNINNVKQCGSLLADYYHRLNSLWREFDALTTLPKDPFPEIKNAYATVSREESYRGVPESSGVSESKLNATSFAAKSFN
ncbi:hypothetical protein Tco_0626646, partial [Tanacetum coccineum]